MTARVAVRVRDVVTAALDEGRAQGVFPGAVAAVAQGARTLALAAAGWAQVVPRRRAMRAEAVFDLASLTKPVATATAVLQAVAAGRLDLDRPVATWLPAFGEGGKAAATVRHLLAHTSGLPGWEMLYLPGPGAPGPRTQACASIAQAVERICATPALAPPGRAIEYSDLGFIVLGYLAERAWGVPLDRWVRTRLCRPLGMTATRFVPPIAWRGRCVATEVGHGFERAKAAAAGLGAGFPWRTDLIRGQVHDGNAWYVGRGVAGHAGLFGTAADLVRFGRMWLGGGALDGVRVLPAALVAEATRDQTGGIGPAGRGLGWGLKGWPFAGTRASDRAFGHTGFTGTSLLVDPERDAVVVLLTNRLHPRADRDAILAFRGRFHDAVLEALDG